MKVTCAAGCAASLFRVMASVSGDRRMDITVREAVVSDAAEVSRLILDLLGFVVADPSSREGEAFPRR